MKWGSALFALMILALIGCGGGGGGGGNGVSVALSPSNPTIQPGGQVNFTATVSNAANQSVLFTVNGGTLTNVTGTSATYTSPAGAGIYSVTATSVQDPSKSDTATITSGSQVSGRIVQVETPGGPNPATAVKMLLGTTVYSQTVNTSADGSFTLLTKNGANIVDVNNGSWVFEVNTVSGPTNVGDLWIGPTKVAVQGTVHNAANSNPIEGAIVRFGGKVAITNPMGQFFILEAPYPNPGGSLAGFWSIPGTITATGFTTANFTTNGISESGGIVDVGTINMNP